VFWEDTRSPQIYSVAAGASTHAGSAQRSPELSSNLSFSIIEAQGWAIDSNGQVILSAAAPTVTPYSSWRSPGGCPGLG
jgi:large exoprotein involved in heme utilization and adhesion